MRIACREKSAKDEIIENHFAQSQDERKNENRAEEKKMKLKIHNVVDVESLKCHIAEFSSSIIRPPSPRHSRPSIMIENNEPNKRDCYVKFDKTRDIERERAAKFQKRFYVDIRLEI